MVPNAQAILTLISELYGTLSAQTQRIAFLEAREAELEKQLKDLQPLHEETETP